MPSLNSPEAFQQMYREVSRNVAIAALAAAQNVQSRNKRMMGAIRFTGDTPRYVDKKLSVSQKIIGLSKLTIDTYFKKAFLEYWELRFLYVKEGNIRKLTELDQKLRTFPVAYAFCEVSDSIANTTFDMYFTQWATLVAQFGLDKDKKEGEMSEFEQPGMGWLAVESDRLHELEIKQRIASRESNVGQEDTHRFPTFGECVMEARHEMAAILHVPETAFDLPDDTPPPALPPPALPAPKDNKQPTLADVKPATPKKREEVLLPNDSRRVESKNGTS